KPPPPGNPKPFVREVPDEVVGVTVAVWPTFTLPTVAVSTFRSTTNELLTTSTCAVELLPEFPFEPLPLLLPLPPDPLDGERPEPFPVPVRSVLEPPVELSV